MYGVPRTNPSSEPQVLQRQRWACRKVHPATAFRSQIPNRDSRGAKSHIFLLYIPNCQSLFSFSLFLNSVLEQKTKSSQISFTHKNGCNTTFVLPPFGNASFVFECFVPHTTTKGNSKDCIEQQACWRCCYTNLFSRLH